MNTKKIALFYGGKITRHLVLIRKAAEKLGIDLKLISYNNVCFDTENGKVNLRGTDVNDFDVVFFRTTGKHWEEVDLVLNSIKKPEIVVIDPMVKDGKPSYACKAWQMLKLREAGIEVPRTIYGSLWYLYEYMKTSQDVFVGAHTSAKQAVAARPKNTIASFSSFPVVLKGSGGDRGTRVFKADNLEQLEKLVRDLRKSETEEGRRYMLQEYVENTGDYRVLVLGDKVLGVMKRTRQEAGEFRNNFSMGGKVEVATLPKNILDLAVRAAKVCGLAVAGVDVVFRNDDQGRPVIWEVNKGPQFKGFMKATGIDVPSEIVKYLVSLA